MQISQIVRSIRAKSPKILVIGDLILDKYVWGEASRISPEAPVQVVAAQSVTFRLGGACNVAQNLTSLGAQSVLFGVCGEDEAAQILKNMLFTQKISQKIIETPQKTTLKTRIMASHQQLLRIDHEEICALDPKTEEEIFAQITVEKGVSAVILSDYGKGVLSAAFCQKIIKFFREQDQDLPILCDPKGEDFAKYTGATLVTPNKKEAEIFAGFRICDDTRLKAALQKLKNFVKIPLVTLSEHGMAFLEADQVKSSPTIARDVFDVSGAGDSVISALGIVLALGVDMIDACTFANMAAGVVVGKLGSATVTLDEILRAKNTKKLVPVDEIAQILKTRQNEKIVFTNGCFDILHRGHIQYLCDARSRGDLLVVGVNSDASVRRLKGDTRPINSQNDRAFLLENLSCVDFVVIFDEDTPRNLIEKIRPDVLIKGGDYSPESVVGREFAREVAISPLLENYSTTKIVQKILRENNENS